MEINPDGLKSTLMRLQTYIYYQNWIPNWQYNGAVATYGTAAKNPMQFKKHFFPEMSDRMTVS